MKSIIVILTLMFNLNSHAETIVLASLDWPPYIGKDLVNKGPMAEIIRKIFSLYNIEVEIKFAPWARSLEKAKNGDYDGIFPEYYDESRLKHFDFSKVFFKGPVGFFKRNDLDYTYDGNISTLRSFRIAFVRGYVNTKKLDNAFYLKKIFLKDDYSSLKMLNKKRVELSFMDKFVGNYLIKKYHLPPTLSFIEPPIEEKGLYMAFSKNSKKSKRYLKLFNEGLKKIEKDIPKIMLKYPLFN